MAKTLALGLLLALAGTVLAEDEPSAEALAASWLEQRFGGDAVEIWRTEWAATELVYGVARRWKGGKAEVLLRVLQPHKWEEIGFLMRERGPSGLQIVYYHSPKLFPTSRKAGRILPISRPEPIERLPFAPGLPVIATVYPTRADDFTFTRLADQEVWGQACRAIEARPKQKQETFDRFVACLSRESGVALDTQWRRGDRLVRQVTTAPADVKDFGGRMMPERIVVDVPGQGNQEFRLVTLKPDVALPDQLFADSNLKTGRFPSF